MSELVEALERGPHAQTPAIVALRQFVRNGKDFDLQKLLKRADDARRCFPMRAFDALPGTDAYDDEAKRFVRAVVELGMGELLLKRANRRQAESPQVCDDETALLLSAFHDVGGTAVQMAADGMCDDGPPTTHEDGSLTAWSRFLLKLTDGELAAAAERAENSTSALQLFIDHAPERVAQTGSAFLFEERNARKSLSDKNCELLLKFDAKRFEPLVAAAAKREPAAGRRAAVYSLLVELDPEKYEQAAIDTAIEALDPPFGARAGDNERALDWLLSRFDASVAGRLETFFRTPFRGNTSSYLRRAVEKLGPAARPLVAAAVDGRRGHISPELLELLVELDLPEYGDLIRERIREGLKSNDGRQLGFVELAGTWRPAEMASELGNLLEHYSPAIRQSAMRALVKLGDGAVAPAAELIRADTKKARLAAIGLLDRLSTPAAARVLEERIEVEVDDRVREKIAKALEKVRRRGVLRVEDSENESSVVADAVETPADAPVGEMSKENPY
jgi:HEAT repeat protein